MKPLQLNLTNFLSYGQAEVPLSEIHVASLMGQNGAGKSSLLDSITFALYGEGRYKDIDRYIRQGQEQATVELQFVLNGEVFRIIRGRNNKGKGKSTLDLAVWKDGDWEPRPRAGASIKETQDAIRNLLKMDFDTFTSSCFMLQGKSDRFSSAQPADRKRILGQILGLEVYDKLQDAANQKAKSLDTELKVLKGKQEDIQLKLAELPVLITRKDALTGLITDKQVELRKHQADLDEVTQQHAKLQAKLEAYPALVEEDNRLKAEIADIQEELQNFEKQVETASKVLECETQILAKVKELESTREQIAVLDAKLQQLKSLGEEADLVNQQLLQARENLEKTNNQVRRLEIALSQREELEKAVAEYRQTNSKLEHMSELFEQYLDANKKVNQAEKAWHDFEEDVERSLEQHRQAIAVHEAKVAMLQESGCIDPDNAKCRFLADALKAKEELQPVRKSLAYIEEHEVPGIDSLRLEYEELVAARNAIGYDTEKERALKAKAKELASIADEATSLFGKAELLENLKQQAAQLKETAETLGIRFNKLNAELMDLREAKTELTKLQASIPLLEKWAAGKDQLPAARQTMAESEDIRRKFQTQIYGKKARLDELQAKFRELVALSDQIEQAKKNMATLKHSTDMISDDLTRLQRDLGMAEQQLTSLEQAKKAAEAFSATAADLAKRYTLYVTLSQAFGKNGIPALIIENALPEIEEISNDLLSRLTNGRMSVEMVTQKENKSGTVSETLDIFISDELGTRPYEGWSGAEKFKVDLSNSLATSKFLARRAGTKIETLVLDENASCLDQEGRVKFIEAIHTIAEDFAKIIVISHIDELKEAFPQQIQVVKTPVGSRVDVVA